MVGTKHKLSPVAALVCDKKELAKLQADHEPRELAMGLSCATLAGNLLDFLDPTVTAQERGYLATLLAGAAKMSLRDVTALCNKQDAGYEGDIFILEDQRGWQPVPMKADGKKRQRHVSYGVSFLRLIDDHKGHKFKLRGVFEMHDMRTIVDGNHRSDVTCKEFRYTKGGKFDMFFGVTPQVLRYVTNR